MSGLHLSPAPPTDDQRSERAESELAARGLGQAPGGAVHVTELFQAPPERRQQGPFGRFPSHLQSPQPQTKEGLWFPLPSTGSLTSTRLAPPFALPRWPRGVLSARGRGCQPSAARAPRPAPSPSISSMPLCFPAGKVASVHPFPNTPPCAPIPLRESKPGRTSSPAARSPAGAAASKPKAKRKRDGAAPPARSPGLPIPAPRPHLLTRAGRPARPPLRAAERPLCGHRGHLPVRGRRRGRGQGKAGPAACGQVRPGAPFRRRAPAPPPAPGLGRSPAPPAPRPHAGRGAPPAPSGRPCLPHAAGLRRRA